MLECAALLIEPWTSVAPTNVAPDGALATRCIVNADSAGQIGFARRLPSRLPRWLSWLGARRIELCEGEDAALLATLNRPPGIGRVWRVCDAEGHRVGAVHGSAILDAYDGRLASIIQREEAAVLETPSGLDLAWIERMDDATLLRFNKHADVGPFVRMVLLAAVILTP